MPEWLLVALVGAAFGSVFSLLGAITWDSYKVRRDAARRDTAVLYAAREELSANLEVLDILQGLAKQDLELLPEQQYVIVPFPLLQRGAWDLVKLNIPRKLQRPEALDQVRQAFHSISAINDTVQSRETFRIMNSHHHNFLPSWSCTTSVSFR